MSAYAVIKVVERSEQDHGGTWWRRNEITIVMSLISFIFPMLFELLGLIEYYHPRMQLRLQLARIMSLNLLNLGSLIWALFEKVRGMMNRVAEIENYLQEKQNATLATTLVPPTSVQTKPTVATTVAATLPTTTTDTSIDILTTTSSALKSITETIFDKITAIVNMTTEFPLDDKTDTYDYNNPDYFDTEWSSTSGYSTTESVINETLIFDDFANFTNDLAANVSTSEMMSNFNLSSLINSVTPFFDLEQYYYDVNDSDAVNGTVLDSRYSNMLGSKLNYFRQDLQVIDNDGMKFLNQTTKEEMRKLCWETMFGQGW